MEKHVVSKERITNHGEVYTRKREVNAMLDLVKQETEREIAKRLDKGLEKEIPILDMTKRWSDEMLYKRYGLTEEEINFIESKIRPMEPNDE